MARLDSKEEVHEAFKEISGTSWENLIPADKSPV